ncbi:MAG TPA: GntR family transcriptional regulator [Acidimicrobiales bacterium]|nr:GntR family transcriptional regulator [Acidimicrobiales bacterium]
MTGTAARARASGPGAPGAGAALDLLGLIRDAIVRGDYSPNERLVESDLAQHFEVSRGAVRAALMELAGEGLVEREANRGARVRAITRDEAIEISEVRMAMEGLCAAKAAERITDAEADELRAVLAQMEAAQANGDLMLYSELNQRLHHRIREISRHPTASRIVERLRNQSVRLQFRLALAPGRTAVSLCEHRAVVAALVARDRDGAERAMRAHLVSVVAALRAMDDQSIR